MMDGSLDILSALRQGLPDKAEKWAEWQQTLLAEGIEHVSDLRSLEIEDLSKFPLILQRALKNMLRASSSHAFPPFSSVPQYTLPSTSPRSTRTSSLPAMSCSSSTKIPISTSSVSASVRASPAAASSSLANASNSSIMSSAFALPVFISSSPASVSLPLYSVPPPLSSLSQSGLPFASLVSKSLLSDSSSSSSSSLESLPFASAWQYSWPSLARIYPSNSSSLTSYTSTSTTFSSTSPTGLASSHTLLPSAASLSQPSSSSISSVSSSSSSSSASSSSLTYASSFMPVYSSYDSVCSPFGSSYLPKDPLYPGYVHDEDKDQSSYSSSRAFSSLPLPPPQLVFGGGRYTSLKLLGKGHFGEAHLVQSARGPAVLKLVRTSTREGRNKALQEAVALAMLPKNSGHLLEVFDFFEEENGICLIVNHCSGGTIQDLLNQGRPVPLVEVSRILFECAAGLRLLHQSSPPIIHRDIKPDNIFLDATSRVQIGDFGLARVANEEGSYYTYGCQPYMAPELKYASMSAASDMWALGCVAVSLLTGQTMEYRLRQRFVLGGLPPEGVAQFLEPILATVRGLPLESVVEGLLISDPKKRLSAADVFRLLGPRVLDEGHQRPDILIAEPQAVRVAIHPLQKNLVWIGICGVVGLGFYLFLKRRRQASSIQRLPPFPSKPPKFAWVHRKTLEVLGQALGSSTNI